MGKKEVDEEIKKLPTKSRQKKEWKGSRKLIIVVFLLTIVPSAFFYIQPKMRAMTTKIKEQINTSWSDSSQKETVRKDKENTASVVNKLNEITKGKRGNYGVAIYDLTSGDMFGKNMDDLYPMASLVKVPMMVLAYKENEAGRFGLENQVNGYTYRQLLEMMGQASNNDAYMILLNYFGYDKLQEYVNGLNLVQTSVWQGESTPREMALMFKKIYQDKLIKETNQEELLKFLTKTQFENWIPAGVPADVRVAHKIGKDMVIFNDVGIVYAPKPYILVIMSVDADEEEANQVLPEISKTIWDFEKQQ